MFAVPCTLERWFYLISRRSGTTGCRSLIWIIPTASICLFNFSPNVHSNRVRIVKWFIQCVFFLVRIYGGAHAWKITNKFGIKDKVSYYNEVIHRRRTHFRYDTKESATKWTFPSVQSWEENLKNQEYTILASNIPSMTPFCLRQQCNFETAIEYGPWTDKRLPSSLHLFFSPFFNAYATWYN